MTSAFGLFAYAVFSTVAGSLSAFTEEPNLLVMVTGILSILQVNIVGHILVTMLKYLEEKLNKCLNDVSVTSSISKQKSIIFY